MSATIIPYEDGPLIVRGDFELRTPGGEPIDPGRGTIALCRCGRSAVKPFCDGTHKVIGFKAGSGRESGGQAQREVDGAAALDRVDAAQTPLAGPVEVVAER